MLSVFLFVLLATTVGASPVVDTFYGPVKGFEYGMSNGDTANIFLGIPFAKPPVGDLRFEKPKKLDKWSDVKEAKNFGLSCQPHHRSFMFGRPEMYGEDCLTLNVMAPAKKSSDPDGYPVFVFIYGGAFELGSSALYGYKNISENFVSEGIVFVTLNYRLSAFGFFSTGDHHMPGNLGLWDQTAALHFIQEVISQFGGNPKKVTISGESAGAASVSALTHSFHSNKLFHQAIAMSGSINSPWAESQRVVNVSKELANVLGCDGESKDILFCMKTKSVDDILDGIEKIGAVHEHLFPYKFHPRCDDEFLPYDLETLLKEAPPIPFITGVTDTEGGLMSQGNNMPELAKIGIDPDKWHSFSAKEFKKFISEKALLADDPNELAEKLVEFYVERPIEGKEKMEWKDYLERFTTMGSDLHYVFPMYKEAMAKISHNVPVYLYVEEYHNPEPQANLPIKGAYHGNELFYLFATTFLPTFEMTDQDRAFQMNLLEAFVTFVKTGKPTVNNKSWNPATNDHPDRFMSFAPESQMKDGFMKESIAFWKESMAKKSAPHSEL
ncbi:hypothetical protein QR680_018195 [Steinernema hermaphroditum]|uniref:Carboxylic ester hydrolase n=1 Tax=Steinernema hermaphroditum TaxID=289476 RepID=A0AA39HH65_9BILA|nr:hypothetical protein QR680_018195 [Steinernema hermaphroditum]